MLKTRNTRSQKALWMWKESTARAQNIQWMTMGIWAAIITFFLYYDHENKNGNASSMILTVTMCQIQQLKESAFELYWGNRPLKDTKDERERARKRQSLLFLSHFAMQCTTHTVPVACSVKATSIQGTIQIAGFALGKKTGATLSEWFITPVHIMSVFSYLAVTLDSSGFGTAGKKYAHSVQTWLANINPFESVFVRRPCRCSLSLTSMRSTSSSRSSASLCAGDVTRRADGGARARGAGAVMERLGMRALVSKCGNEPSTTNFTKVKKWKGTFKLLMSNLWNLNSI